MKTKSMLIKNKSEKYCMMSLCKYVENKVQYKKKKKSTQQSAIRNRKMHYVYVNGTRLDSSIYIKLNMGQRFIFIDAE